MVWVFSYGIMDKSCAASDVELFTFIACDLVYCFSVGIGWYLRWGSGSLAHEYSVVWFKRACLSV